MGLIPAASFNLIAPRVESSQSTYGVPGSAAALLFGLFVIGRRVVAAACEWRPA